jgi:ABC-2 type transport system ATP-binding protein
MTDTVIRVENLRKLFGTVAAVDGLSFAVERGTTVALLGANGAGKTTTISILLGLLLPTSGQIEMLGENMLTHRHRVLPRVNFSSPYVDLPHRLTVRENLIVYGHLYGVPRLAGRIGEVAELLDIGALMDRAAGKLSAGQKTRVALAKAMLNAPEILLLDEPTASLDPDSADWVRSMLRDYQRRQGATVLLASHNMTEVERLCDTVLIMKSGRVVDQGSPDALIARHGRETMEEVFLDIARNRGREPIQATP